MKLPNVWKRFWKRKSLVTLGVSLLLVAAAGAAMGANLPKAGDLLFPIYDIYARAKTGGGDMVAGGFGVMMAAGMLYKGWWIPAGATVVGTGGIIAADTVAQALGALIG